MFNKQKLSDYVKNHSLEIHVCNLSQSEFKWLTTNFTTFMCIDSYDIVKTIRLFYENGKVWITTYRTTYSKCQYSILKKFKKLKVKSKLK